MGLNLFDLSSNIQTTYKGLFSKSITTEIYPDETNSISKTLDTEKKNMSNEAFIKDLKSLISSSYNNDIELLAKNTGIPAEQINNCLLGISAPIPELIQEIEKHKNRSYNIGDNIQIGGSRIEINNTGDGMTNHYKGMLAGIHKEMVEKLKAEIADLRKMLKEKDELIAALKDTIEVLKSKQ